MHCQRLVSSIEGRAERWPPGCQHRLEPYPVGTSGRPSWTSPASCKGSARLALVVPPGRCSRLEEGRSSAWPACRGSSFGSPASAPPRTAMPKVPSTGASSPGPWRGWLALTARQRTSPYCRRHSLSAASLWAYAMLSCSIPPIAFRFLKANWNWRRIRPSCC